MGTIDSIGMSFIGILFFSIIGAYLFILIVTPMLRWAFKTDETLNELREVKSKLEFISNRVDNIDRNRNVTSTAPKKPITEEKSEA